MTNDQEPAARLHSNVWPYLLIAALVAAAFARTIDFGPYFDDQHFIRPWTFRQVTGAFAGPFDPQGIEPDYYRPLVGVSFGSEWSLWGYDTRGYHVTSVLLHIAATLMVFTLLRRLCTSMLQALTGALFFAIVASNAATAIYLAQRSDAMAAIAIVSGLLCLIEYEASRRTRWLIAVHGCFVVAVLAKEIGIALIPMAMATWWFLRLRRRLPSGSEPSQSWPMHWRREFAGWLATLTNRDERRGWVTVVAPLMASASLYLVYRQLVLPAGALNDRFAEAGNPASSLLSGLWTTFKGVPWEVAAWTAPGLAGVTLLAFILAPRSSEWRLILFGGLLSVGGVIPLTFSGGTDPRLLYVAQIGMATVVAGVVGIVQSILTNARDAGGVRRISAGAMGAFAAAFVVALIVTSILAQNEFRPGSDKKIAADYTIWSDPSERDAYPPYWVEQIEQRLIANGRLPD